MGNEQLGQVRSKLCFQIQVASKMKQMSKPKTGNTSQKSSLSYGLDLVPLDKEAEEKKKVIYN